MGSVTVWGGYVRHSAESELVSDDAGNVVEVT